jgi:tRNA pseudouridine(55) synthase
MQEKLGEDNLGLGPLNYPHKVFEGGLLLWKKLGSTPLEAIEEFRIEQGIGSEVKMTYAGRLDPAAQGELLVLIGNKCKEKDNYLGLDKTYKFQILIGPETDTLDLLGLVSSENNLEARPLNKDEDLIRSISRDLVGAHQLPYPAYSSKTVEGKPLWQYAREGDYDGLLIQNLVPINRFIIHDLKFVNFKKTEGADLVKYVETLVQKVSGDFRQDQVVAKWRNTIDLDFDYQILEFEVVVSAGAYVRQIAQRILEKIGKIGVVFSIVRTKIHLPQ